MTEQAAVRLRYGTALALYPSREAAEKAVDSLVAGGYPRELVSVLTGRPWSTPVEDSTGIIPDPDLRVQLVPASAADSVTLKPRDTLDPRVAAFASSLVHDRRNAGNPVLWPVLIVVLAVIALIWALSTRDWIVITIVLLVALHLVVAVTVLAYGREAVPSFPFRSRIPTVEKALNSGGVLVAVRCTLPYRSRVQQMLAEAGGDVLGYASHVYPVPAA